jgi:signal transduction histidine kinase
MDSDHEQILNQALEESESIMVRFQGLLRVAELDDIRRRSAFAPLQIMALLQQAHEFYEPLALDRSQTLSLEITNDLPQLYGDSSLMFEALVNLLDNAIKFTPEGGHIKLRGSIEASSVIIEVADDGTGIPETDRTNVIRRLYRGDASRMQPGHGLGLSLVAAIVKLHGYTLDIQPTTMHSGTRVLIVCPMVSP